MALTRAQVVTEIGGWLGNALALAGLSATDTAGNLREPVNATLRALGVAESDLLDMGDLVPDSAEAKALAFARYFALDRVVDAVQDLTDVSAPGGAGSKDSQTVASLERQRDRALVTAEQYGLRIVDATDSYAGVFTAVGPW